MSEITKGMRIEQEHRDITHGDSGMTRKIVNAHLKEDAKYYTHLERMEEENKKEKDEEEDEDEEKKEDKKKKIKKALKKRAAR